VKNIADREGLVNCLNERKGIVGNLSRLVATRLESQEVQVWQAAKATSPSLGLYA